MAFGLAMTKRPTTPAVRDSSIDSWARADDIRPYDYSSVILSKRSASKDLRTKFTNAVNKLRRFLRAAAPWSE